MPPRKMFTDGLDNLKSSLVTFLMKKSFRFSVLPALELDRTFTLERTESSVNISIIKDCCVLEDNTVLPAQTTVPPFVRISGNPGIIVGFLPNCTQNLMIDNARHIYKFSSLSKRCKSGQEIVEIILKIIKNTKQ
ncbi:Dynactin subunit 5 [Trichinella britovi]|uniref:Dynactin subunit 5 n=1 Tax=Trichinella britovi TaxID=45882 RepID=A0A0V1CAG5_TRIBR|nr:Dynactin subunit 5 [Trichinella britovi]